MDQREHEMLYMNNSLVIVVQRKKPAMHAMDAIIASICIASYDCSIVGLINNTYHASFFKKLFCHVGFLSNLTELSMASWSEKAVVRVFHHKSVINHQLEMVEIFQISYL